MDSNNFSNDSNYLYNFETLYRNRMYNDIMTSPQDDMNIEPQSRMSMFDYYNVYQMIQNMIEQNNLSQQYFYNTSAISSNVNDYNRMAQNFMPYNVSQQNFANNNYQYEFPLNNYEQAQ